MAKPDIDKLLGDEPEEQEDVNDGEGAGQDPSADKDPNDQPEKTQRELELEAENERLRKANKGLNRKVKEREQEPEPAEPDPKLQAMTPAQLREEAKTNPAAKAWLDLIDEAVDAKVKPIRASTYRDAVEQFVAQHPEYAATAEGRGKFKALEAVAKRNGLDEAPNTASIVDLLTRAHAFNNPTVTKPDPAKARANKFAAAAAAPAQGEPAEGEDYTPAEMRAAEEMKCTPEEARAAAQVYGNENRIDLG